MADITQSNHNPTDASNTSTPPDGMPEGQNPSTVNDWARAFVGAVKRWYNWTIPTTTAGTSTAYTLTYTPAPGALADGMSHLVLFNATNGAAPTLNVNSLGAKAIHKYAAGAWGAVASGDIVANSVHRVAYNLADTTYRIIDSSIPIGALQAANNLSDVTAAATARVNLKVDQRTAVADAIHTVAATDRLVAYTSLSTARTVTLPAATAFNAGQRLVIVDESGSASATNAISLAPNGTNTIAGSNTTQVIINVPHGRCELECDGTDSWHVIGPWSVFYTNSLSGDVALNNTANYFSGPTVAQGTVGTWFAWGTVTLVDTAGAAALYAKLWDGTTVVSSGAATPQTATENTSVALSGYISAPAASLLISCRDATSTSGAIKFNVTGNSKDSTITVQRIA